MSKPISDKKNVKILIDLCRAEDVTDIIISPGSRNAPLTLSFAALEDFDCYSIVDERSAAFFALGMAQQKNKMVALVCTSGTALLNYAPAIAEAYYQNIPLIIISADRPGEWIDQADGQTIRQHDIFHNYIKYSCTLPVDIHTKEDEWYAVRQISEGFKICKEDLQGPVHINIPLREPLYGRTVHHQNKIKTVTHNKSIGGLPEHAIEELVNCWSGTERILILMGMRKPDAKMQQVLDELEKRERIAILTESLSNCYGDGHIRCIDRVVSSFREEEMALYRPDLLITFDGQIVSKMVKTFLRANPPKEHWHISASGEFIDTYQQLSRVLEGDPSSILNQLIHIVKPVKSRYRENWKKRFEMASSFHNEYVKSLPWSDFKAFNSIVNHLPKPCTLQLGNSTPVRYAQLFDEYQQIKSFSNRGTSGIDGSVSTAVGAAVALKHKEQVVLITGDLSFFYDSNALWNNYIPTNLKIIILNNGGGGIFRFIQGPAETEELEEYFATGHNMNAELLAKQYSVNYHRCENNEELEASLPQFFEDEKAMILEVMTPAKHNAKVLKNYFATLKS